MTIIQSFILGITQGLTEFLPVSSSAHLTIVSSLLKVPENIPFFVFLHLATLLAVVIFFRKEIFQVLLAFSRIFSGKNPVWLYRNDEDFKLFCLLLLACLPTAIIGYFFENFFEAAFGSLPAVGIFLIITGFFLWATDLLKPGDKSVKEIGFWESIFIGVAQGVAIAPGISRSGATVAAALFSKMNRQLAVRFSFLLSIPAILGAAIFEAKKITGFGPDSQVLNLAGWLGFLAAFISGYLAIYIFIRLISHQKLRYFSIYCSVVGIILILTNF